MTVLTKGHRYTLTEARSLLSEELEAVIAGHSLLDKSGQPRVGTLDKCAMPLVRRLEQTIAGIDRLLIS